MRSEGPTEFGVLVGSRIDSVWNAIVEDVGSRDLLAREILLNLSTTEEILADTLAVLI
jgi:hypothetical protein